MSSDPPDFLPLSAPAEWLAAAADRSEAGRARLVRGMGQWLSRLAVPAAPAVESLAGSILLDLMAQAEVELRQALAEALADSPGAPAALVEYLAADVFPVAAPVLLHSPRLSDAALISLCGRSSAGHRQAMARRPLVTPALVEELARHREVAVLLALLENPGAIMPEKTLRLIAEESRSWPILQPPLIEREELSTDLAAELYWLVAAELKHRLKERFDLPATVLDRALAASLDALMESGDVPDMAAALDLAERLERQGRLTPALLLSALRRQRLTLFVGLFSRLLRLPPDSVRRLVKAADAQSLAIAVRALDMPKPAFASLFLLSRGYRPGDKIVERDELPAALAHFDRFGRDTARVVLRQWQMNPAILADGNAVLN